MLEIFISILIFLGALFIQVAAVGLLRLPDLMTRIQSATKATSFGLLLILFANGLYFGSFASY